MFLQHFFYSSKWIFRDCKMSKSSGKLCLCWPRTMVAWQDSLTGEKLKHFMANVKIYFSRWKKGIERKPVFFGSGGNLLGRKVRLSTDRAVTQESIRRTRHSAVAISHTIPGEIICSPWEYTLRLSASLSALNFYWQATDACCIKVGYKILEEQNILLNSIVCLDWIERRSCNNCAEESIGFIYVNTVQINTNF